MRERVIISFGGGNGNKLLELTEPFMRRYAKKIGADFTAIRERKYTPLYGFKEWYFDVFQVYELTKDYDRVLYLDADILVNPIAPDIFEIADKDKIAVVENAVQDYWRVKSKEPIQRIMGIVEWLRPYWEEGVLVIPKEYIDIYNIENYNIDKLKRIDKGVIDRDQALLNYIVERRKIPLQFIDDRWNGIENKIYKVGINKEEAYFMHMTCLTVNREAWIRYYIAKLLSKELPPEPPRPKART